jgi:hypothetical protein
MEILTFLLGTVGFLLGWRWLARKVASEREGLVRALGLAPPSSERVETRAERGFERQELIAAGEIAGRPVELWTRSWRPFRQVGRSPSICTVLVLPLAAGAAAPEIRVEPRLRGAILDARHGPSEEAASGDPAFDSAFRVAAADPRAAGLLDAELREGLLEWRRRFVGSVGSGALEKLADAAASGFLEVEPGRIGWIVPGSPGPALEPQLRAAFPLLEALARRVEGARSGAARAPGRARHGRARKRPGPAAARLTRRFGPR